MLTHQSNELTLQSNPLFKLINTPSLKHKGRQIHCALALAKFALQPSIHMLIQDVSAFYFLCFNQAMLRCSILSHFAQFKAHIELIQASQKLLFASSGHFVVKKITCYHKRIQGCLYKDTEGSGVNKSSSLSGSFIAFIVIR